MTGRGVRGVVAMSALAMAAAAKADALDVQLHGKGIFGESVPSLDVRILEPIAGFEVILKRSDGQALNVKGGGKPGVVRTVELNQPEGRFSWEGEIKVLFPNGGEGSLPLKFESELWGPLRMTMEKGDVDVENRKATFKLSRPAARAQVIVTMDTGVSLEKNFKFSGEPAGTPLNVEWAKASGAPMQIAIKAWDTAEFFIGVEMSPWRVDIPHDELNFDTGKADIRKDQQGKLDTAYEKIADVVQKYGSLAKIRLFVAGHTDTVGDKGHNRQLSLARARSIGAYLRKRGLRIPILYEGFGEEALLVATDDEKPEEKNRRAEYIVAVDDPDMKNTPIRAKWQKL